MVGITTRVVLQAQMINSSSAQTCIKRPWFFGIVRRAFFFFFFFCLRRLLVKSNKWLSTRWSHGESTSFGVVQVIERACEFNNWMHNTKFHGFTDLHRVTGRCRTERAKELRSGVIPAIRSYPCSRRRQFCCVLHWRAFCGTEQQCVWQIKVLQIFQLTIRVFNFIKQYGYIPNVQCFNWQISHHTLWRINSYLSFPNVFTLNKLTTSGTCKWIVKKRR